MPNQSFAHMQSIEKVVKKIFPHDPMSVERVREGSSTYVYRIIFPHKTFYLRVLPEEEASFAPEVAVHAQLFQMHIRDISRMEISTRLIFIRTMGVTLVSLTLEKFVEQIAGTI